MDLDEDPIWTNIRTLVGDNPPALVYCESAFKLPMGKTAHRLIQHGEVFDILGVIDSTIDASSVAGGQPSHLGSNIPIFSDLNEALTESCPEVMVIGLAPPGGRPDEQMIQTINAALREGLDIVSGLNTKLAEYPQLKESAVENGQQIHDIRVAPDNSELVIAEEFLVDINATIITIMGTDSVVGKGTITYELYRVAQEKGLNSTYVATGQTGIMCGSPYGIATDRLPVEYAVGTIQRVVRGAANANELIFVEGQAALTHPRYVADDILKGSCPDSVVLADDSNRENYKDTNISLAGVAQERAAIEAIGDAPVVAIGNSGDESANVDYPLPAYNVLHEEQAEDLLNQVLKSVE